MKKDSARTWDRFCGLRSESETPDQCRSPDRARRPVNCIICDGPQARPARMGDYDCAIARERIRHPCRGISANPFADQCAHCRPLDPRLASLRSGVVVILKNPINWGLTQRRLWATPLFPLFFPRTASANWDHSQRRRLASCRSNLVIRSYDAGSYIPAFIL